MFRKAVARYGFQCSVMALSILLSQPIQTHKEMHNNVTLDIREIIQPFINLKRITKWLATGQFTIDFPHSAQPYTAFNL